jgi:hypothetical protein
MLASRQAEREDGGRSRNGGGWPAPWTGVNGSGLNIGESMARTGPDVLCCDYAVDFASHATVGERASHKRVSMAF